ncbi:Beta,beta-carotene 9',10'-oxygenase [Nymphon striatum]|nr:Beta,beta-carotene 9',10'-oxygenase [Nymphon striatum]
MHLAFAPDIGNIPEWMNGNYFMNGPGKFETGDFKVNHLFDGYAMIVKFDIKSDAVKFQSRFIQSDAFKKFTNHGKPVFQEFGTPGAADPDRNAFGRFVSKFVPLELTDNVCANFQVIGNELYASSETNFLWLINQDTLETIEKVDISKILGTNVCCSHPHITPDGTIYNAGSSFGAVMKYNVFKVDPPDNTDKNSNSDSKSLERKGYRKGEVLFTISSKWSTCYGYYHSFGMTENYFILIEQCLTANIPKLVVSQMKGKAIKDCLEWIPNENTRFILMDRRKGNVSKVKYLAEPFFVLHHINAFEEGDDIVVDLVAYNTAQILDNLFLDKLKKSDFDLCEGPQIRRYVLPVNVEKVEPSTTNLIKFECDATAVLKKQKQVWLEPSLICKPGFDIPRINYEEYNSRKYKFVYGCCEMGPNVFNHSIIKVNMETKSEEVWVGPSENKFLEPIFVKNPNGDAEDDGLLLFLGISLKENTNHLLMILDAKQMKEVARVDIPSTIFLPFAFHGCYIPRNRN